MTILIRCCLPLALCVALLGNARAQLVAFPGAEGAGAFSTGGRGGDFYHVTNLNNSGPGSLRTGISTASGPRTIVFDVDGTIHLTSTLDINRSNITIAGQTAPGGGITIADRGVRIVNNGGMRTHDVILQHVRLRVGDLRTRNVDPDYEPDSLWITDSEDVIVDHVSASWGVDEVLSTTNGADNVTVQWSTITEALRDAGSSAGNHGYGSLINGGNITYAHNLYAFNDNRNPRPQQSTAAGYLTQLDFVNNVISSPGSGYGYTGGGSLGDETLNLNYVGNYGIFGPGFSG